MRVAAHDARLDAPPTGSKDGIAQRVHLQGLVKRGPLHPHYAWALRELMGPEIPEAVEYLWDRFQILNGMRHEGVHGPAPFTPETIYAANELFCWQLEPQEVDALRLLDLASRHPEITDPPKETT